MSFLLFLLALGAFPGVALAQVSPVPTPPPGLVLQADSLYFAGHPDRALALLEGAPEGIGPPEHRWRAQRSLVALAFLAPSRESQNHFLDRVIRLTEEGPSPLPTLDEAYWTAAAEGLRALNAGPRYGAELGVRARRRAQAILEEDPSHGGAHNVLGRAEMEFLRLNRAERLVARLLLGRDFPSDATWESAEEHLRRGATLWPHMVLFHLDLARFLEVRGRPVEARQAARRALATTPLHPPDRRFQDEVRALAERLEGR